MIVNRRGACAAVFAAFLLLIPVLKVNAAQNFRVMTMNMYVGTDVEGLLSAQTPQQLVEAIIAALGNIEQSDPKERIEAMALEIADRDPDLVGLQEAVVIRAGAGTPVVGEIEFDFLAMLLQDLEQLGKSYQTVAIVPGLNLQGSSGLDASFMDRTVIIARSNNLKLRNQQVETFGTQRQVSVPLFGTITDVRGWASVDIDRKFRFVTTHLENVVKGNSMIQQAQAAELLKNATKTPLQVVMAADFNANADDPSDATYQMLLSGRGKHRSLTDAWTETNPGIPEQEGYTCCQTATTSLSKRIDLVLHNRGQLQAREASRAGVDKTASGLFPSDHAAVEATFRTSKVARVVQQ